MGELEAFAYSSEVCSTITSNGQLANFSGFLYAVQVLRPKLDTDGDRICDELDLDNDNDGIDDVTENNGAAFDPKVSTNPNQADSDGDGATDWQEMVSGTSATNSASALVMTGIRASANGIRVSWKGGTIARQHLLRKTSLTGDWEVVLTKEPPTQEKVDFLDTATNSMVFYAIKAELAEGMTK